MDRQPTVASHPPPRTVGLRSVAARRMVGAPAAIAVLRARLSAVVIVLRHSVALSIATAVVLTGLFLWQVHALLTAEAWLQHTDQAMKQAITLQKVILDAETGMRGYLLSGQVRALRPYRDAEETFATRLVSLRTLVSDNARQVQRLDDVEARFATWTTIAQRTIRGEVARAAARDFFSVGEGVESMDFIRDRVSAFLDEEQEWRIERSHAVQTRVVRLFVSGAALTFALRLALTWMKRKLFS